MINLIKIELFKIFAKPRSYIAISFIFFIALAIEISIWLDGERLLEFITNTFAESFYYQGNVLNGYFISYIIINTLWIHVPILVAFVTGDLISGEANNGTLRIVLSKPVNRLKFIFSKFIAGSIYSSILVITLALLSLVGGILLFGTGDLIVIASKLNVIPENQLLLRFIGAFSFGILSMAIVSTLAFMCSAFSNNSLGPVITTIGIIIGFSIISNLNIPAFVYIKPFLFTSYLNSWKLFFDLNIDNIFIYKSAGFLIINIIVFLIFTGSYFNKKDILS